MDKNQLIKLYVEERKSYDEIAAAFNISRSSVYRWVKKYELPRQIKNIQDLSKQVFNKIEVLEYVKSGRYRYFNEANNKYINGGKYDVWKCQCECGEIFNVKSGNLKNGHTTQCKKCSTKSLSEKLKKCPIDYNVWYRIVKRCNRNGIELNLTPEELYELFKKQGGRCALSGIEIHFGKTRGEETTASPDRIDNSKGYIKDNIQWVHKTINCMRNKLTTNLFIDWCKKVANNYQ